MPSPNSNAAESDRELIISRVIGAPRELVFDAWTDPRHIDEWYGPDGFRNTTREIDVRPGGLWRFVMHGPDGTDYENCNTYHEVTRPERLVFAHGSGPEDDDATFLVTVTFTEQGHQTLLTMRSVFKTKKAYDTVVEFGAIELGQQSLARFGAFVAKRRSEYLANARPQGGA